MTLSNRNKSRLFQFLGRWWKKLTTPYAADDIEARLEYMTKVILLVMTITLYIFTLIVIVSIIFDPYGSEAILIMVSLDIGATISVWFTHHGGWRYSKYIPPLAFILMGMAGTYLYGLKNNLVLFYALAVILAAFLLGNRKQWGFLIFCIIAHSVIGLIFHPTTLFDLIAVIITLSGSLLGISFLVTFAMQEMDKILLEARATNQRILFEVEERKRVEKEKLLFAQNYALALQSTQKFFFHMKKRDDGEIYTFIYDKKIPPQFGFSIEKLHNKNIKDIWNEEVSNIILPQVFRAFNGEVSNLEVEISGIFCQFIFTPVFIRNTISEVSGVCTDITEQKRAQIALKESEERLRRITDNMMDMVIQTDRHFYYVYISPSVEGILGYKPEDLIGKSIYYLVHPDDKLREISNRQLLVDQKIPTKSVARYKHARGHYVWLEMMNKPLFAASGEFTGIVQGARDISENRRTEEALLASEKRFRSVFDHASMGISLIDQHGYIHITNEANCKFLGYTQEELIGSLYSDFVYSDDKSIDQQLFAELESGKREFYSIDKRHICKNGKIIWGRLSISCLRESDNNFSYTVVICENITDTKRIETLQNSLYRISEAAGSSQDLPQLYKAVHYIIGELIPAKNFYIALHDSGTDVLSFPYFVDEFDENPGIVKMGRGLTEYVLRLGQPVLASPQKFDELVKAGEVESVGTPSIDWIGVPLKTSQNATIGAMVVQTYTEGIRYTEEDKDMLTFVSVQVGMAIERKRAYEALKESEHRWQFALQGNGDGVWDWDLIENTVQYSPRWKEMLGYEDNEIGNQLGEWYSRIHPEDFPLVKVELQRHFKHETPVFAIEYRMLCKDNSYKWILDRGKVLSWANDDSPIRMIGTHSDISQRKQTEQWLRIQHDLSAALASTSILSQAINYILHAAGQLEYFDCGCIYIINRQTGALELSNYYGISQEVALQLRFFEKNYNFANTISNREPVYLSHFAKQSKNGDLGFIEKLGAVAIIPVLHEDHIIALLILGSHMIDEIPNTIRRSLESLSLQIGSVLARIQTQQELIESRENLQTLFDAVDDFLIIVDPSLNILQFNPVVPKRLGYAPSELSNMEFFNIYPAEQKEKAAEIFKNILPEQTVSCSIPLCVKDNGQIPVESRITRGKWKGKEAYFIISRDISERKKTEARLEYMSSHDILTGLYNRNFFETELKRLQNSRYYPITILIADVDGLKAVNDNQGHTAGDNLLKACAQIFTISFRPDDIVARIGGDEFCVLLPKTDQATGRQILKRVSENINLYNSDHKELPIELSMGLATGDKEHQLNQVFMQADYAMYQMKEEKKSMRFLHQ